MTLALAASLAGADNAKITLAVTGATGVLANKYTSDFTAGVDGWSAQYPGAVGTFWGEVPIEKTLIKTLAGIYVQRTITGLTAGHLYRIRARALWYNPSDDGPAVLGISVVGVATGDTRPVPDIGLGVPFTQLPDLTFTATASSHDVRIFHDDPYYVGSSNYVQYSRITVDEVPAAGTALTIQRTDANGAHYVRLQQGGEDPDATGALTVDDEEFALVDGPVVYVVRDAVGHTATAAVVLPDYGYLLLSSVGWAGTSQRIDRLDGLDEAREFGESDNVLSVIGRADPLTISSVFAWSLRRGTLTFYAADYAAARAIIDRHTNGRVALLRQVTHPGADLYYVATRVRNTPTDLTAAGWRWAVQVDYVEIGWPDQSAAGIYGWSWTDLQETYLAWWNVADAFATWADVVAGP